MPLIVDQTPGPLLIDILNSFQDHGHDVALYAGEIKQARVKLDANIKIVKSTIYNRQTPFSRIRTWLMFCIRYSFFLVFCKKPKAILVVTNPPFAPLITAFIARFRRIPFYILIYDLYPEALAHAGYSKRDTWFIILWKKINRIFFQQAEKIFTISETMKQEIVKYQPEEKKIIVIHNWADNLYIKPIDKSINSFISQQSLNGKKIVLYSGNLGLTHDLESIIDAAAILKDQEDIFFLIVGDGAKKKKLENRANELGLRNVRFLPYQNQEVFPLVMASADIGIVTLGIGNEAISVPSKLYTNMAAGICILAVAQHQSELNQIILKYNIGLLSTPGRPEELAKHIYAVLSNDALLKEFKKNSLEAIKDFTSANAGLYVKNII